MDSVKTLLTELLRRELLSALTGLSGVQSVYLRKNDTKNILLLFTFYTVKEEPEKTESLFGEEKNDTLFDLSECRLDTSKDFKIGTIDFQGRYRDTQINNVIYNGIVSGIEHYKKELCAIL